MADRETLSLRKAARTLGISQTTLRKYVKDGTLQVTQGKGKYGPEYRIHPGVLRAFALQQFDITLPDEQPAQVDVGETQVGPVQPDQGLAELYERLLTATAEATKYRVLTEQAQTSLQAAEKQYQDQIAELLYEKQVADQHRVAAEQRRDELQQEKLALAAELEQERGRGFWSRLFGGGGA